MTVIGKEILEQFRTWFDEACAQPQIRYADAMNLATVDSQGKPSSRMVLLKHFDEMGFVFFTNYHSRKSANLTLNPKAALCLYWEPIRKQIRIEGRVEMTNEEESEAYFGSRPRESQIGAWASAQSDALESRDVLIASLKKFETKYDGMDVPRPPNWGGWRVIPDRIEFWQEGDFRLHERVVWSFENSAWIRGLLNP